MEIEQVQSSGDTAVENETDIKSFAATSNPKMINGLIKIDDQDLLNDSSLVDNYSDILNLKSKVALEDMDEFHSVENGSVSGSVVLTPTNANISPLKQLADLISARDKNGNNGGANQGEGERDDDSMDLTNHYDYSDSEFEENLEKRLKDMGEGHGDSDVKNGSFHEADDKQNLALEDAKDSGKSDDASIFNDIATEDLDYAVMDSDDDENIDDDNEDDEEEDDDYQQLSPPKELDPEKLYALFPFDGPHPSHCQLDQDESCILLNDQDAYWWLIKKCSNSKIGFAPAEILETHPERLARLNCWKNENSSFHSLNENDDNHAKEIDGQKLEDGGTNVLKKGGKSVSFNDVISYADRYIEENSIEDEDDEDDESEEHQPNESKLKIRDEITRVKLLDTFDDNISEVVSDVSFATGSLTPLNVKKTRQVEDKHQDMNSSSNPEEESDMTKLFEAPVLPFSNQNSVKLHNSNSDYSISTIGEFSPSSSEMTNDSPKVDENTFETDRNTIPLSEAITDISKIVKTNNDAINLDNIDYIDQIDSDSESDHKSSIENEIFADYNNDPSVEMLTTEIENQPISESPKSPKVINKTALHSSSDEFYMETERALSAMSISSTHSESKNFNTHKNIPNGENGFIQHPLIDKLYHPLLDKMNSLLNQIDSMVEQ